MLVTTYFIHSQVIFKEQKIAVASADRNHFYFSESKACKGRTDDPKDFYNALDKTFNNDGFQLKKKFFRIFKCDKPIVGFKSVKIGCENRPEIKYSESDNTPTESQSTSNKGFNSKM